MLSAQKSQRKRQGPDKTGPVVVTVSHLRRPFSKAETKEIDMRPILHTLITPRNGSIGTISVVANDEADAKNPYVVINGQRSLGFRNFSSAMRHYNEELQSLQETEGD